MRHIVLLVGFLFFLGVSNAEAGRGRSRVPSYGTGASSSSKSVRGYTTKRGTYVAPYHRSSADSTQRNNYSTKGNRNPWTGSSGTKRARR